MSKEVKGPKYKSTIFVGQEFDQEFFPQEGGNNNKQWPEMPANWHTKSQEVKQEQKQAFIKVDKQFIQSPAFNRISPTSSKISKSEKKEMSDREAVGGSGNWSMQLEQSQTELILSTPSKEEKNELKLENRSNQQQINDYLSLNRTQSQDAIDNLTGTQICVIPEEVLSTQNEPCSPYSPQKQQMYQQNINKMKERIMDLKDKNNQLETKLTLLYTFKKDNQRLNQQNKIFHREKQNLQSDKQQLQRQLILLQQKYEELQRSFTDIKNQLTAVKDKEKNLQLLKQQIESTKESIKELYSYFSQQCKMKIEKTLGLFRERTKQEHQNIQQRIKKLRLQNETDIQTISKKVIQLKVEYQNYQYTSKKKQESLKQVISTLNNQKCFFQSKVENVNKQFAQFIKNETENNQKFFESSQQKTKGLQSIIALQDKQIKQLQTVIYELIRQAEQNENRSFQIQQKMNQQAQQLRTNQLFMVMKYQHEAIKSNALLQQIKVLKDQIESLKPQYQSSKSRKQLFDKVEQVFSEQANYYEGMLADQQSHYKQSIQKQKRKVDALESLLKFNETLSQQEVKFAEQEMTLMKISQQKIIAQLRRQLAKSKEQIGQLEYKNYKLQQMNAHLQIQKEQLQALNEADDHDRYLYDHIIFTTSQSKPGIGILQQLIGGIQKFDKNGTYKQLLKLLKEAYLQYDNLSQNFIGMASKQDKHNEQLRQIEEQNKVLVIQGDDKSRQLALLNQQLRLRQENFNKLVERITALQLQQEKVQQSTKQNLKLRSLLNEKQAEIQNLRREAKRNQTSLKYEIEKMKAKKSDNPQKPFERLQNQLNQSQAKIQEIQGLKKELKLLKKQNHELQVSKSQILSSDLCQFEQINELKQSIQKTKKQLDQANQTISNLELQIKMMKSTKPLQKKPQQLSISPASSTICSNIAIVHKPESQFHFQDSMILKQKNREGKYLLSAIEQFIERMVLKTELQTKMIGKTIQTSILTKMHQEIMVMLFKQKNSIFAAISFPPSLTKDVTVIMASLNRQKTVFPSKKIIKSLAMKNERLFLTFGSTEAKFIWHSRAFVICQELYNQQKYFQPSVSLKNDIFGFERVEVQEFEIHFIIVDK